MFDLEKALAAWRRSLAHRTAFDPDDLDELERHLRDRVAALVHDGASAPDAFDRAVGELGSTGAVEAEYRKVFWAKRRRRDEVWTTLSLRAAMLRSYLLVAVRGMRRQRGFHFLNLLGLTVGTAGCLLLGAFVYDELRFDTFHRDADLIYRVTTEERATGGAPYAHTFPAAGPELAAEMPEVEHATRLLRQGFGNHDRFEIGEHTISDPEFLYVDTSFFDVFTVPFVEGSPADALVRPNTAIMTRDAARRYFGSTSPLGAVVTVPNVDVDRPARWFEIVGVVEGFPPHSHVHFDFLLSLETWNQGRTAGYFDNNWRVLSCYTYLRLRDAASAAALEDKLPAFVAARAGNAIPEAFRVTLGLQRLTDIHLHSRLREEFGANGAMRNVYIVGAIAVFLLLIAGINYVNLATARASARAREVAVRKVVGAHRLQLARQFLIESFLAAGTAVGLALLLFVVTLPAFNVLSGKALTPHVLLSGWMPAASILLVTLTIAIAAGGYPAFLLSAFRPAAVLKGGPVEWRARGTLRKSLVFAQFGISIGLMIATAVMYRQLSYMQHAPLGFEKENVIVLDYDVSEDDASRADAFRQELMRHPGVRGVTFGSLWPTRSTQHTLPLRPEGAPSGLEFTTSWYTVDSEYADVLGLELLGGRGFGRTATDASELIVNEAAVRDFGWDEPIGKRVFFAEDDAPLGTVIGIVRDFHYRSLVDPVGPVVLAQNWWRARRPIVKIAAETPARTLAYVEQVGSRIWPDESFSYTFLDQAYSALYEAEDRMSRTLGFFTLLALSIACLGLFGLAAFTAQRRTKEIGVRKVLGASVASVTRLLTMEFVKLVSVAFVAAAPVAYVAMQRWLDGFSYRIELGADLFLLAGTTAIAVAVLTVGYQTVRAAAADPVKSLRYE